MTLTPHVLIVTGATESLVTASRLFEIDRAIVTVTETIADAVRLLEHRSFHLIVAASHALAISDVTTLVTLHAWACPIVVIASRPGLPASDLLKAGVSDIVTPPIDRARAHHLLNLIDTTLGAPSAVLDHRLTHVLKAIRHRYHEAALSSRVLSNELALSHEHLCRLIKQQTRHSFGNLLRERRHRVATSLLAHSNVSIKQIAAASGFSGANSLGRSFATIFAVRPSAWRRLERARRLTVTRHMNELDAYVRRD